jgi:hypothetical protein
MGLVDVDVWKILSKIIQFHTSPNPMLNIFNILQI